MMTGTTPSAFNLINMPVMQVQVTVAKFRRGQRARFCKGGIPMTHETEVLVR